VLVTIRKIISSGEGIGWSDGATFFVPFVIPGETVEVTDAVPARRAFRATAFSVIEPSPLRRTPPCALFGRCGGCAFLHMPYDLQREVKLSMMGEFFRQNGRGLPGTPRWVALGEMGLRSRAKVHVAGGRPAFRERLSHETVPFDTCPLLHPGLDAVIREDAARRPEGEVQYEYAPAGGGWTPRDPFVVKVVSGEPFRVSCGSFFQASEEGAAALAAQVAEVVRAVRPAAVLDLFCGAGLFSRFALKEGCSVAGLDIAAAEDFAVNVPGGRSRQADLSRPVALPPADLVVADPPRAGMAPALVEAIARHPAQHLCYVSCDGATFVRDLLRLERRGGFVMKDLAVVDQFPATRRIELVAHLVRGET